MDKLELSKAFAVVASRQDEMNKAVNPDWATAGYNWPRALWTEVGEAMGYVNWPWWKKGPQAPDGTNKLHLFLELADILHFGVSVGLEGSLRSYSVATLSYNEIGDELATSYVVERSGRSVEGATLAGELEAVARDALKYGTFDHARFFLACTLADMSAATLIAYYHGKGVLNHFRQEHGYKQGTYRKIWSGDLGNHEDNLYLADLIEAYSKQKTEDALLLSIQQGSFESYIRMNLSMLYSKLSPESEKM